MQFVRAKFAIPLAIIILGLTALVIIFLSTGQNAPPTQSLNTLLYKGVLEEDALRVLNATGYMSGTGTAHHRWLQVRSPLFPDSTINLEIWHELLSTDPPTVDSWSIRPRRESDSFSPTVKTGGKPSYP